MIYEFRIAVRDIGVPIWRDIQVNSDETFYDFNSIIQAAFSWSGFFEHRFEVTRSGGTDLLPIIIEETPLDTLEDYTDDSDFRGYSDEEREDVNEIEENEYELTGTGFADLTRLAGSNPEVWVDILESNGQAIGHAIEEFQTLLAKWKPLLTSGNRDQIITLLKEAKKKRDALGS